ncbi:hypothetical protein ABMA27_003602 [Loxostege sticticalis]|uniref:RNA-directed DNA polymerase n=1 Tax=Loxostege sticticalis TaxID=481309 RepID=A0ABR3HPN0_LOXSC
MERLNLRTNNMPLEWKNWSNRLKIYLRANKLEDEDDKRKVAILLQFIGPEALAIFYSFDVDIDVVSYKELLAKFEAYFLPKVNVTMERHKLFNRRQQDNESIDDYVTDLKNISHQCEFGVLRENLLRDVFSLNLHGDNQYLKEKLLTDCPKTLEEAVNIAKSLEETRRQSKILENSATFVGQVKTNLQQRASRPVRTESQPRSQSQSPLRKKCGRCGQLHKYKCPAMGVQCHKCRKPNHFASFCRTKSIRVLESHEENMVTPNDNLFIGMIYCLNNVCSIMSESKPWHVDLTINDNHVQFLLDSGADTNVISYHTYKKLGIPNASLKKSIHTLSTFSGEVIPTLGQCNLLVSHKNDKFNINFHIVDLNCQNIIGRATSKAMNLIKKVNSVSFNDNNPPINNPCQNILKKYETLFEGLGCLTDFECDFSLKPDVTPTISPCRRVPFKLQGVLKEELNNLEQTGVICRVEEPTSWVSPLVIVSKKNGQIRLCIDTRHLNMAIMRPHYQFPTLNEIRSALVGAKYFSTLDANKGYWMLKLSEASSKLCTFITPFGRFRFTRLPFGINAAPEIFHNEMVKRFGDIEGVKIMLDDFLIFGKTESEHNERLEKVLQRAAECNLKFNKAKSKICQSEVKYLGHVFSADGVKVDEAKVEAICKMPSPTTVPELQRFMGMVNYLSPFIKNLSHESSHLRSLLSKNVAWNWTEQHQSEFDKIKNLISSTPVLTYYDPDKEVILSVDASKDAMGAVLCHGKQPISYASASLNNCQQNYSQIEKELLSVLFGCTKFHQYVYGQQFTVETDHKPLITLFKKALHDIPPRLQRIMLRLQPYDIKIVFKPGRYLYVADTLSRMALPEISLEDLDNDLDLHVNLILSNLSVSPEKLKEIQELTSKDKTLCQIIQYCKNGWPEHKRSVSEDIRPYFPLKSEIHVINDIVFKSNNIIIPESFRNTILDIIHKGHQGINSCIRLAKTAVYWPKIDSDIEKYVGQCNICLSFRRNNSKEPLLHHDYKLLPWNKVGLDLFDFDGGKYLIVVDYYSKYVEIALLKCGFASNLVIVQLKSIFARHGIPNIVVSDNGPPFNSSEFRSFAKDWDFQHVTSSPYLSCSNGMVERTVGIVKNMLKKCHADKSDPYLALLMYRNTPKLNHYSPAELSMSRSLRTVIPITESNLQFKAINNKQVQETIEKQKVNSSFYCNKNRKQLKPLSVGDKIMFKHKPNGTWVPGIVSQVGPEPRSFIVNSPEGSFRRNRIHIIKPSHSLDLSENHGSLPSSNTCDDNTSDVVDNTDNTDRSRYGRVYKKPSRYVESC